MPLQHPQTCPHQNSLEILNRFMPLLPTNGFPQQFSIQQSGFKVANLPQSAPIAKLVFDFPRGQMKIR
jgi:hypothetical protein